VPFCTRLGDKARRLWPALSCYVGHGIFVGLEPRLLFRNWDCISSYMYIHESRIKTFKNKPSAVSRIENRSHVKAKPLVLMGFLRKRKRGEVSAERFARTSCQIYCMGNEETDVCIRGRPGILSDCQEMQACADVRDIQYLHQGSLEEYFDLRLEQHCQTLRSTIFMYIFPKRLPLHAISDWRVAYRRRIHIVILKVLCFNVKH
jgi:hypothetical protein